MVTARSNEPIRVASSSSDFEAFSSLVAEYVAWSRTRYEDLEGFVAQIFGHQSLASELDSLSSKYAPPQGRALLAMRDDEAVGCGAYRRLDDDACEMKRLFVPDRHRGHGFGRSLSAALIASARDDGYDVMRLDTCDRFTEAIARYETLGFSMCAPYRHYPPELAAHLVFMELPLR